jgi:hypothetical protein
MVVQMTKASLVVALALVSHLAVAGTPVLAPYKGANVTVSFPKGWTVADQNGVYVAQQDPKRADAASILFIYSPAVASATEDQLLDAMTGRVASDFKVTKRAPIPGGGHLMIGDGTVGGIKVRLGAVAIIANGQAIVSVLVAKTSEFDGLGGIGLATQVAGSLQIPQAAAPPPQQTPAAPASSGPLTVPPPTRQVTLADMQGQWQHDDHVLKSYVSVSTGGYAGYSVIADTEKWFIDAKGNMTDDYAGTHAGVGGTFQVSSKHPETITIDGNLFVRSPEKGQGIPKYFWIRGWEQRADITVIKINGPYYDPKQIEERCKTRLDQCANLDEYWVRITKK